MTRASTTSAGPRPSRWAGLARIRDRVRGLPGGRLIWRIGVTLLGLVVILVGLLLIPLPGPGWVIVFLGLGIWSTEYEWARRLLLFVRTQVGRWVKWIARQPRWLQLLIGALGLACTAAISYGAWYLF